MNEESTHTAPVDKEAIRNHLKEMMARTRRWQAAWELPALPPQFEERWKNLDQADFYVVVCGEVKKGKSTLLNAILGDDVLPVGTEETSSQVFCISHAENPSYALVFEDGSREPITREGLTRYGSQTMANLRGEPIFQGKTLKWIEVNVPAAFLPKGVHLLDTPGLGAVYALHAEVTLRQIEEADAVVYLLDSKTPVTDADTRFINRILKITNDVIFVQSRIDERQTPGEDGRPAWEVMNEDHVAALSKKYGQSLGKIVVHPISSLWLRRASGDDKNAERTLARSRFKAFQEALSTMMYKVAGWNHCVMALGAMTQYYPQGKRWLDEQKQVLSCPDSSALIEIQKRKKEINDRFLAEWGEKGKTRLHLIEVYQDVMRPLPDQLKQICLESGRILPEYYNSAEQLNTLKEINAFGACVGEYMKKSVLDEIRSFIGYAQAEFMEKLPSINLYFPEAEMPNVELPEIKIRKSGFLKKCQSARMRALTGASMATGAVMLASVALTGGVAVVPLVYAGFGGTLLGGYGGWKDASQMDILQAKNTLKAYIASCMKSISIALFNYDMREGRRTSFIHERLKQVESDFQKNLTAIYQQQKQRHEQEVEKLMSEAKLKGEELAKRRESFAQCYKDWVAMEAEMSQLAKALKQVEVVVS